MDDLETSLVLIQLAPMTYALLGVLVIPFVMYVVARWRTHRDQVVDPQLGIKVALNFFAVTAFQAVLAGLTVFFYAMITSASSDAKGALYRTALGIVVPAGVVLAAHVVLLARTNQAQFPTVRRMCAGYNLLVTGLLGFASFVLACEALFKRGSSHELGRVAGAGVLVYGSAWVGVGVHFAKSVLATYSAGGPPPTMSPPSSERPRPPEKTEPALPALGTAYPPIDPP